MLEHWINAHVLGISVCPPMGATQKVIIRTLQKFWWLIGKEKPFYFVVMHCMNVDYNTWSSL